MLGTPAPSVSLRPPRYSDSRNYFFYSPVDGPPKEAIESLQNQIDFHVGEANRLRYAQNLHVAVSRLPAELLVEAFLYVVESGLQDDNARFTVGTFSFLQVCRRWNEVAVGFPQLWSWWVAGGFKAWPIFNSRSKNVPILLAWRHRTPASTLDVLTDPAIPKRLRQLDFSGTSNQLQHLLGALESSPPSNASSVQIQIFPHEYREPQAHLVRFLSSPFPKLSRLDLASFLPDCSSPIFTTSRLTSLKLFLPFGKGGRYTLSQFSHILRRHPSLRELELNHGAIPLPELSGSPPVSFTLPQLVTLRLYGAEADILGFLDLTGMSSPLHDVVVRFGRPSYFHAPALASTVKKVLVAYYECQGLGHHRRVSHITISCDPDKNHISFNTRCHPVPTSDLRCNLKIQFNEVCEPDRNAMVKETFPLFPLDDVRGFALEGSVLYADVSQHVFRMMKNLSHLRLDDVDLWLALEILSPSGPGMFRAVDKKPC